MILRPLLAFAARNARFALIVGLVAGVLLPDLALAMRPWVVPMIAGLMFLAALRVGPRQLAGAASDLVNSAKLVALFQLALPLVAVLVASVSGAHGPLAIFTILMLAAAPISGSPNITVMTGNDPAPAMRLLIVGTAMLPLTALPIFWFVPAFGAPEAVVAASAKLLVVIGAAAGLAFLLRATVLKQPTLEAIEAIDGVSAVMLAVVVVGLMSAVGPALWADPAGLAGTLALVCVLNLLLQLSVAAIARWCGRPELAAALGIVAGNRNIALFLTVLPPETVDSLLLLIGCYQVPMYLTPAVLGRFYRRMP